MVLDSFFCCSHYPFPCSLELNVSFKRCFTVKCTRVSNQEVRENISRRTPALWQNKYISDAVTAHQRDGDYHKRLLILHLSYTETDTHEQTRWALFPVLIGLES